MFERLTHRDSKGDVWIKDAAHVDEQGQICMLADRLAAYEDSGLSHEESQELAKAKTEGRLVVLPCKVGDTVYWASRFRTGVNTGAVEAIKISDFGFDLVIREAGGMTIRREFEKVLFTREAAEKALEGGGKE
jgi:hypothetical protein